MLLVLCIVLEIGHLWVARGELVKALEAASLAAAKHWAAGNSTTDARDAAISLAGANEIRGVPVVLTANEDLTSPLTNPNGNDDCDGNIVLGGFDPAGTSAFEAAKVPTCGGSNIDFAVRTQATVSVPSLCKLFGPFNVSAKADAVFRCSNDKLKLVRFSSFTCP